jgi:hypothetical protein
MSSSLPFSIMIWFEHVKFNIGSCDDVNVYACLGLSLTHNTTFYQSLEYYLHVTKDI